MVYVALGSGVAPHKELVAAMAAAFEGVPGARFLWSLNKAGCSRWRLGSAALRMPLACS